MRQITFRCSIFFFVCVFVMNKPKTNPREPNTNSMSRDESGGNPMSRKMCRDKPELDPHGREITVSLSHLLRQNL